MTKRRKARSLEFEDTLVVRLPTRKPRKERYLSVPPLVRSALRPGRGGRHLGVGKFVRSGSRLNQRVLFKARFCRGSGGAKTIDAFFKHVRYLMRDGVGEGGKEARVSLNGSTIERPDSRHTIADWADDRHHFRFILSPEKGKELDLESFGNDFMSQVQRDLQTKLTYFTVCHYNTDNPHVHIVLRGKKDDGADLCHQPRLHQPGHADAGGRARDSVPRLPLRKRCYGERGARFGRGTAYSINCWLRLIWGMIVL